MTRFKALLVIGIIFCEWTNAQNLVPNSGFEEYKNCPIHAKQFSFVKNWKSPTSGTPDYFNSCSSEKEVSIPKNFAGKQEAHTGNAYAGIDLCDVQDSKYREFVEVKFAAPLKKDKTYHLKMYISLSGNSKYCVNNIGAYFSSKGYND